jgi:ATP-dependent helicase HrpB
MLTPLPVDKYLSQVISRVRERSNLVLRAEPGAGKTTRVPRALLDAGLAGDGEVLVLQPRRLAARLAARRVCEERGERLGDRVGYQVRFEEIAGPSTRLRFMTEGVLTRRLLADPALERVGAVILDEFHERHLDGDLCLALLRRLQLSTRPDLKLVVMSATLDPQPIARYLGDSPTLDVPGRPFEVTIEHLGLVDPRPLEAQVASAVRRLIDEGLRGDVLVFLPGAAEIRKAREACEPIARRDGLLLQPLHGDLPPEEQDRAVRPGAQRKVILSTNVAETSVTLEGVTAVVDSGLARLAGHNAWSGLPTLKVCRVSKASAIQRAGRAGRLGPGRCLRLYTRHDFQTRPEREQPELMRLDLAQTVLALHGAGVGDLASFVWLEPPPGPAMEAAERLLSRLGALSSGGALTERGREMLRFPVHPRLARVALEAEAFGRGREGRLLAALLGEREIRLEARGGPGLSGRRSARVSGPSDLLESLEVFEEASRRDFDSGALRSLGLDPNAVQSVERVRRSLGAPRPHRAASGSGSEKDPDRPLLISLLAGYPDRVARRRAPNSAELLLASGGGARLADTSVVREGELLIALDVEERGAGARAQTLVRLASRIEPEWLLDLFPDRVREAVELDWSDQAERVEAFSRLTYDGLVIEESRSQAAARSEAASQLLATKARARGARAFAPPGEIDRLLARMEFAAQAAPDATLPRWGEADLEQALGEACAGRSSFAELREGGLVAALLSKLSGAQRSALDRIAPERVSLPSGRRLVVQYEPGKPPWIASRLQDFFGMAPGPMLAGGRVPLVLHLLAPNQRPVQVTTDLAGFWDRHYPALRRELCRKYPRHSWPEDPRHASPPVPRR